MYDSLPCSYWEDDDGVAHIVDDHGAPGPIVWKPLCEDANYHDLVDRAVESPPGVWVEGRDERQPERSRFHGPNPRTELGFALCADCQQRYLALLWRRPVDYPALEVEMTDDETYMVADLQFVADDELTPCVQLVDELGRTKQVPMRAVETIVPHDEMPVVY